MRFVTVEKFPPPLCLYDHKHNCRMHSKKLRASKVVSACYVVAGIGNLLMRRWSITAFAAICRRLTSRYATPGVGAIGRAMKIGLGEGMRTIIVIALGIVCASCATVIRGTADQIGFNSTPSGAEVHTSNGLGCVTPCTLAIKKTDEFVATFEKPGFIPQQVPVTREVVGGGVAATAGNIIVGGVVGLGVDAVTGAGFEHTPNPVSVVLEPVRPAQAPSSIPASIAGQKSPVKKKPATASEQSKT